MPSADGHSRVLCLGAAYLDTSCEICASFGSHTLQERCNKLILKGLLTPTVSGAQERPGKSLPLPSEPRKGRRDTPKEKQREKSRSTEPERPKEKEKEKDKDKIKSSVLTRLWIICQSRPWIRPLSDPGQSWPGFYQNLLLRKKYLGKDSGLDSWYFLSLRDPQGVLTTRDVNHIIRVLQTQAQMGAFPGPTHLSAPTS